MSAPEYGKVFVVGCPRSGTTWLRDIYQAHPQAVTSLESALLDCLVAPWWEMARAEVGAPEQAGPAWRDRLFAVGEALLVRRPSWYAEWRKVLLDYFDNRGVFLLHHNGIPFPRSLWVRQRGPIAPYRRLLAKIAEAEAAGGLDHEAKVARIARGLFDDYFLAHGGTPGHVFVEKTPSHLFHARFLLTHFPDARIVEVVRDGRDVCVSMDAYKKWMPQDRKYQIWMWSRYVAEGGKLLEDPRFRGRVMRVRYEDLKRERELQTARLLAFSGLETPPDLLARIVEETDIRKKDTGEGKHYRKGAVGGWRERLSPEDQDLFRRMAGRELASLGYGW